MALIPVFFKYGKINRAIYTREANYFIPDCNDIVAFPLKTESLVLLDPNIESQFFYSLGEYLFKE